MSARIALEAAWRVPALRFGPRRWRPLVPDGRHLPIHWCMKAEQLAVVQGWDDTRATLRRWNADPWRRPRRAGRSARWPSRRCCSPRPGSSPTTRTPDPTHYSYPGLTRPATSADFGFVLLPQRHSCSRCTRWPAWPGSWPARGCSAERLHGIGAAPRARRPARDRVRRRAPRSSRSLTQAYALGHGAADLAAQLGVSPLHAADRAAPARAAGAVRALPAARRLDDRQPPRRLGRAARRHVRHDGDRDPAAACSRRRSRRGSRRRLLAAGSTRTDRYTF